MCIDLGREMYKQIRLGNRKAFREVGLLLGNKKIQKASLTINEQVYIMLER